MATVISRQQGPIVFHCHYFNELLAGPENPSGRLPQDIGAHALWYYYIAASQALKQAKDSFVYEDDLSPRFTVQNARSLLEGIAVQYGIPPAEIVRYWDAVEAQRRALKRGLNAELPAVLKFRFN